MEPTIPLKKPRPARSTKERLARIAFAAALSLAMIEICQTLPDKYKLGCTMIARIIALIPGMGF